MLVCPHAGSAARRSLRRPSAAAGPRWLSLRYRGGGGLSRANNRNSSDVAGERQPSCSPQKEVTSGRSGAQSLTRPCSCRRSVRAVLGSRCGCRCPVRSRSSERAAACALQPTFHAVSARHDEGWLAPGKRRRSHSILHCCSLDKNSLSREALGFIAVCFSCDDQQHRFVWAAPDNPSPGPPQAGRPITHGVLDPNFCDVTWPADQGFRRQSGPPAGPSRDRAGPYALSDQRRVAIRLLRCRRRVGSVHPSHRVIRAPGLTVTHDQPISGRRELGRSPA